MVPILLSATDFSKAHEEDFLAAVWSAFRTQYSPQQLEHYKRLPTDRKALIIDDWHKTKLRRDLQRRLIAWASRLFGKVIIISGDIILLEEMSGEDAYPLVDSNTARLRNSGICYVEG